MRLIFGGHVTEARWGVVATVREPSALVLAFVAWHLSLGAEEVRIFLDDPGDPVFDELRRIDRCHVIRCDAEYWEGRRKRQRPPLQSVRQLANATWAYNRTKVDWLLHIDADEFLWLGRPLTEELAALGPDHGWLKLRNWERCWGETDEAGSIFSGRFRKPCRSVPEARMREIYGPMLPYLQAGFAGYPVGKGLSRTGRGYRLNVHSPKAPVEGGSSIVPPFRTASHAAILHFDGLTPMHWAAKTLRYAEAPDETITLLLHKERQRQVRRVRDGCRTLGEILAFHASLFELTSEQEKALAGEGRIAAPLIDPAAALDRIGLRDRVDISAAAFDAALGPENEERFARLG
ncbi:glycosyltransferase family 2 protein [Tropicimonas sp. IMCC34011]|uniref:glycosyltransferase family 2 protein n=1 Tax=Tropicimonas sp. IMCC34011 TaxID=2248759 RepID=UPI0013006F45|nr:glycosyltransferase family 2 protein [Tropicimonas sp. IMCC34011]